MIGVHLVVGAYGFWLPNDPRRSWSTFVGSWDLFRYGKATTVATNHSVAGRSVAGRRHDAAARFAAKQALRRPAVRFDGVQARAIGRGFAACAEKSGLRIWACAILPDHWHLVVAAQRLAPKQLAVQLKGAATRRLVAEGIHPCGTTADGKRGAKCFARGEWGAFWIPRKQCGGRFGMWKRIRRRKDCDGSAGVSSRNSSGSAQAGRTPDRIMLAATR